MDKRIAKIVNSDLSPARKVSQLTIMSLKVMASSPIQREVIEARTAIMKEHGLTTH